MSLQKLYQSALLAHNRAPKHRHEMPHATHSARGTDAMCGDDVRIWLRVEGNRITEASWSGDACVVTTATASILTDWLPGSAVDQLRETYVRFSELMSDPDRPDVTELGELNVLRNVGAFPSRRRNALLPWETALKAIERPGLSSASD